MPPTAKRIAICLSVVILLASWALTINGFFVSPNILRRSDEERARALADAYGAYWASVAIDASDGPILRG